MQRQGFSHEYGCYFPHAHTDGVLTNICDDSRQSVVQRIRKWLEVCGVIWSVASFGVVCGQSARLRGCLVGCQFGCGAKIGQYAVLKSTQYHFCTCECIETSSRKGQAKKGKNDGSFQGHRVNRQCGVVRFLLRLILYLENLFIIAHGKKTIWTCTAGPSNYSGKTIWTILLCVQEQFGIICNSGTQIGLISTRREDVVSELQGPVLLTV